MKFLVPDYSCLQNPCLGGNRPPDPRSLCPLSSTEFVEPPPPGPKFLGTPLRYMTTFYKILEACLDNKYNVLFKCFSP